MSSTSCFRWFGVLSLSRVVVWLLHQSLLSDWFACFWRFPHVGCLAETRQLPCVVIVTECVLMAQLVVMTTQNCPTASPDSPSPLLPFLFTSNPSHKTYCALCKLRPTAMTGALCLGLGQCQPPVVTKTPPSEIPSHFICISKSFISDLISNYPQTSLWSAKHVKMNLQLYLPPGRHDWYMHTSIFQFVCQLVGHWDHIENPLFAR